MTEATGTVRTTCPYCGVGCGVLATRRPDGGIDIAGDPDHPANFGRLCSKGSSLAETLSLDDRLLHPEIGGQRADWDTALDLVAARFSQAIEEHGPDSVAFYVSGQILTEDYYVANKLMKGFIGSANIDTNSRLCMASSVAGHRRAFGADTVPGTYEDLEQADLVVLTGSNLAWCHPVLFQRLEAAREANPAMRVVVIDPRETATCALADLHLALKPDTDVALFNGLLAHLSDNGALDHAYVGAHTSGLQEARVAAGPCDLAMIARETGLAARDIALFFAMVTRTEKTVTVYSQGVNQSVVGTDKVNAILNVHLATGRIGRPGMGPFSVTGQPNAMGGREVGGLANMLAAHMDIDNPDHRALVKDFWQSPVIADRPGFKAVELFEAVAGGRIKALWIMATSPVDSLPDANRVAAALETCPFVVVSEVTRAADTVPFADVLLPAAAWGEKDGTVTNSERRISRQRRFLDLPGEVRADWWQLAEVARRMGFAEPFDYQGPAGIFREHAALSAAGNDGTRDFDIGALAEIGDADYAALEPFHWPKPIAAERARMRFFAEGGFFTTDRKAVLVPVSYKAPMLRERRYPFTLNTGRVRDQWHTMTRTGTTVRLSTHIAEPFVELHTEDAARLMISPADLVEVRSPHGAVIVRAQVTDRVRQGEVFVPMHWTDQFASSARIDAVVAPRTDPVSGQPGSKFTPVSMSRQKMAWYGFAVLRRRPATIAADYWAIARTEGGFRLELAGRTETDRAALVRGLSGDGGEMLEFHDAAGGRSRIALWREGQLDALFYFAGEPVAVSRGWACGLLAAPADDPGLRHRVLAGRGPADGPDKGAIVCSCFQVGANEIAAAVAGGARTVQAVGTCLKAGTNCGSCRSEIRQFIETQLKEEIGDDRIAKAG